MPSSRWERVRAQAAAWKADRAVHGPRHATVLRLRQLLDLGPVTTGRVDQMSDQIEALRGRAAHLDQFSRDVADTATGAAREAATTRDAAGAAVTSERDARELFEQVWSMSAWLESVPAADETLVSVVLPTRGRRDETLRQAVDSVLAQGYACWQLIVVVDGDDDTLATVRRSLPDDDRIEVVRSSGTGVSAARNTGLDRARGELIAYLDDDNLMGPLWLKGVALASARYPDAELFFGAELVDSPPERGLTGSLPVLHLAEFDRKRLRRGNYLDQNVIAHRRDLPEAHYDEALPANVDWDFLLRATAQRDPVMIPLVASCYLTDKDDRLTGSEDAARSWTVVRARARMVEPLRILALNQLYPLTCETYIGEDLAALGAQGAEIVCCPLGRRATPGETPYRVFFDPRTAVAEHGPDVVLVHWTGFALQQQELLHELGIPYAVRGHSFANEPAGIRKVLEDPLCVGVWSFPGHKIDDPRVHALPSVFTRASELEDPASKRDLVVSLSSALPKKDFPLLVSAFAALPGVDRRIVVGLTAEHEGLIVDVVDLVLELEDPPLVQANLTRSQVFDLLRHTALLVYTLTPDAGFGNPSSVIEGMVAGTSVVLPDRPEVHEVFGPDIRTYRSATDIAEHARIVLRGGPDIEAERERLRGWALEHFCDPETGKRFYAELVDAVTTSRPGS